MKALDCSAGCTMWPSWIPGHWHSNDDVGTICIEYPERILVCLEIRYFPKVDHHFHPKMTIYEGSLGTYQGYLSHLAQFWVETWPQYPLAGQGTHHQRSSNTTGERQRSCAKRMDEVVVKNGCFNVQRGPKKYASKIRTGICFYKYQTHSRVEEHPLKVYTLGQFLQHCKWVCHGMSQNYNSQILLFLYQTSLNCRFKEVPYRLELSPNECSCLLIDAYIDPPSYCSG